jgi:threonine/homoserine/homoserine lactone efflux protein
MGPAGIESVRWTISKGFKNGIRVAIGALIADAIDVMLINFGLLELIKTNKLLEVFFWMLSGVIIFIIGYKEIINKKKKSHKNEVDITEKKETQSRPLLTGFVVNVSNPMTHFFWLTLSSTVISVWRYAGRFPYFIFAVSLLLGMFISLFGINFLVSKGKKIAPPKASGKVGDLLAYGITAIGVGFFAYEIYKLVVFIK